MEGKSSSEGGGGFRGWFQGDLYCGVVDIWGSGLGVPVARKSRKEISSGVVVVFGEGEVGLCRWAGLGG